MVKASGRLKVLNGSRLRGRLLSPAARMALDSKRAIYASWASSAWRRIFWLNPAVLRPGVRPLPVLLSLRHPLHDLIGTAAVFVGIVVSIIICRWSRDCPAAAFTSPCDLFIVVYIMLKGGNRGSGAGWPCGGKGTFTPAEDASHGQEVQIPLTPPPTASQTVAVPLPVSAGRAPGKHKDAPRGVLPIARSTVTS